MRYLKTTISLIGVLVSLTACVRPTTRIGQVSPEQLRAEQLKQQQLVIQSDIEQQQRLDDVAHSLFKAAVPLCGGSVHTRTGVRFANAHAYERNYQAAAVALGFSDTLVIVSVARGSSAERSGLRMGDKITRFARGKAPMGKTAIRDLATALSGQGPTTSMHATLGVRRSDSTQSSGYSEHEILVAPDTTCAYGAVAVRGSELNAWADGRNVFVTSAMMRLAITDEDLGVVVAHEIAHNAMRHIDAKRKNAALGAVLGAIVDIAAATQGVNTQGEFASHGARFGAMTFSQDFEREADYVGLYILARSGRSVATSANFWRRMAVEKPGSIQFATSHPTTAERFLQLERATAEIDAKRQLAQALLPEMRRRAEPSPVFAQVQSGVVAPSGPSPEPSVVVGRKRSTNVPRWFEPNEVDTPAEPASGNRDPEFPDSVPITPGRRTGVGVAFVVDARGIIDTTTIRWSNPNDDSPFREAVLQAMRTWRYAPALKDGKPVPMAVRKKYDFVDALRTP